MMKPSELPAGVRVKAIDDFKRYNKCLFRATTAFGQYSVSPSKNARVYCDVYFSTARNQFDITRLAERVREDEAEAICQRHHEEQVCAQLEVC